MPGVPSMGSSERLRRAIAAAGIPASAVAAKISMSRQNFQRFLTSDPGHSKHWSAIAEAVGVSVEWLTTGSPAHEPDWIRQSRAEAEDLRAVAREAEYKADLLNARAANALLAEELATERAARLAAEKALTELLAQRSVRTAAARHDLTWQPAGPSAPSPTRSEDGRLGSDDAGTEFEPTSTESGSARSPRGPVPVRSNPRGER